MADIVAYPVAYGQRHVVLVVEDDQGACRFLLDHLKRAGFHAVSVVRREEACRLIRVGVTFDIVLSDIGRAEGLELAYWIADNAPNVPMILVLPASQLSSAETRGAEIFTKPYAYTALVRKLRDTLQRNRPRPVVRPKKNRAAGTLLYFMG